MCVCVCVEQCCLHNTSLFSYEFATFEDVLQLIIKTYRHFQSIVPLLHYSCCCRRVLLLSSSFFFFCHYFSHKSFYSITTIVIVFISLCIIVLLPLTSSLLLLLLLPERMMLSLNETTRSQNNLSRTQIIVSYCTATNATPSSRSVRLRSL